MKNELSVYNYSDPVLFLLDYLKERKLAHEGFSIRSWAREMGLKSHTLLVMLLNKSRNLRTKHLEFLQMGLELSQDEKDYFSLLVELQNTSNPQSRKRLLNELSLSHPGEDFSSIEYDQFEYISDWVYMAILAMTQLKGFKGTEDEVYSRIGHKVSKEKIRSCLTRLLNLGLIKWDENNCLSPTYNRVKTKDDVLNYAVQEYHKNISLLASKAVEELPLEDREFQSFTLAIDDKKMPLAKKMIRDFRKEFSKAMGGEGDHVHNMNIQLFKITK